MRSTTHPERAAASPRRASGPRRAGAPTGRHWSHLGLKSLQVQLAIGSAVVVLAAVAVVTLGSLVGMSLSEHNRARSEMAAEVSQLAAALGKGDGMPGIQGPFVSSTSSGTQRQPGAVLTPTGLFAAWEMDTSGHVTLYAPASVPDSMRRGILRDEPTLAAALRRALQGQASEDDLSGTPTGIAALLSSQLERLYAAAPIRQGGGSRGEITGAVALSTPPPVSAMSAGGSGSLTASNTVLSPSAPSVTVGNLALPINQFLVVLAITVALLAGAAAVLFARRLTRPLDRVMAATARMGSGNYAIRISIPRAPAELRQLAATFNEMAATIERDVGELHRQEQVRRELVADVSHDLATPLTMIRGFTETLSAGVVHDPARREALTAIMGRETARLQRLVDQLREIALFEAGVQSLQRTAVHLPAVLGETVAALAPAMQEKQVTLSNTVSPDLPAAFADSDRVAEILFNLLDNALRHTPEGGYIEVTGAVEDQFVRLCIADAGPGISPSERQRVFERFYRVDSSRNSATGGSGLGLAIVKAIVEAHGGSIRIDEGPEGGAVFEVNLPIHCQASVGHI